VTNRQLVELDYRQRFSGAYVRSILAAKAVRRPNNHHLFVIVSLGLLLAVACTTGQGGDGGISRGNGVVPELDSQEVEDGARTYQAYCASCHGADLSGEDNWKTRNPDGSYPAPPQDSSGHTWHHSDTVLLEIVRYGIDMPESRIPAFGGELGDDQIRAVIAFFKSNWGTQERSYQWQITQQETLSDD
jgi:mono/diheme cytochrome c family protein